MTVLLSCSRILITSILLVRASSSGRVTPCQSLSIAPSAGLDPSQFELHHQGLGTGTATTVHPMVKIINIVCTTKAISARIIQYDIRKTEKRFLVDHSPIIVFFFKFSNFFLKRVQSSLEMTLMFF